MIGYPGSLHNHTEYSNFRLRDAITRHTEMIDYAIEIGHNVIAFTEHETISNAVKIEKYYNKIKKDHPDFKVILGNEIYLCRDGLNGQNFVRGEDKYYHFILLAKDAIGHKQIRELSTRAWLRSYLTGKMRRVPTYYQDLLDIVAPDPGHIIATTACLGGFLGTKLLHWRMMTEIGRTDDYYTKIKYWLRSMEDIFGRGNFYLEMQPSTDDEQVFVNKEIIKLSDSLDIPYIISTDTHYLKKEDAPIHAAFLKSQEGDREVDDFYKTTYMMSTVEIEEYMSTHLTQEQIQTAYKNILDIRDKCEDYSLLKPLKIPSLAWKVPTLTTFDEFYYEKIPYLKTFRDSSFDGDRRLAELVIEKLTNDPRLQNEDVYRELNENLEATWVSSEVNKAHWSAYFLNLQQILDVCWDAGSLVGPGRGSGVGFLLLYILDIIQINPMWETTKTFAWRFLNPKRASVLDIDTDIEGGKRGQVLDALRKYYGQDRVSNIVTFGTEGSKQAIQTAARGLDIDNDIALYISSLIPADRGKVRTLKQCYYGDDEFTAVPLFVQQMNEYPQLWEVAQKIEGLISRVGEHAGGVIFVDEPFTNSTALMKIPSGDVVTQFDLHDCEDCSLIKIDLLSIEALDKIHFCMDLLIDQGYMSAGNNLRETYENYLNIYRLERNDPEMWRMVWDHSIQSLFQMEKQSGIQGIALTKPESVDDLAVLNSVIRLMAQSPGEEQPLNKYARYKEDISQWYQEMTQYGLTKKEQELLKPILESSYGIAESQEKIMSLVQMPECGGFDLSWADSLRKAVAKKKPAEFLELQEQYFAKVEEKGLSKNLCNYVWNVLVAMSRGYSFNLSHTLAYSLVALQEMNLAHRFPIIFWNCACLIADSGGAQEQEKEEEEIVDIYESEDFEEFEYEDAEDKQTKKKKKRSRNNNYDKIATAIGKMRAEGINIVPPDINKSSYTFVPDAENNQIYFGFRGMLNVGDDIIATTIANRPYISPRDYLNKVKPKKGAMISLIKAGAFDSMMERKMCMAWYLWETCDKKTNLTLQNMPTLIKYNILPRETEDQKLAFSVYEFNRYIKSITKADPYRYDGMYTMDTRAIDFINRIGLDELLETDNLAWFMKTKAWDKVYQKYMDVFRNWLQQNKQEALTKLNDIIFMEQWEKYAKGTISAWEMESMCYYYHEHELANVDKEKYGFSNFFALPEEPVVDHSFFKGGKQINLFKLSKICGTCIGKNKDKGSLTLLTPEGVVSVKFRKEYFALFDKQISERGSDGVKHVVEKSWFNRGEMVVVQGMRSGDQFIAKKYATSGGHQLYKIRQVLPNGCILLQTERAKGESD